MMIRAARSVVFKIFCMGAISALVMISLWQSLACALTADELKAQAGAARERMGTLQSQAEQVSEALNDTRVHLETTNTQIDTIQKDIDQKTEELKAAQARLARRVAVQYRLGPASLLSMVLEASDFSDLIGRMYYANKVAQADKAAIDEVKKVAADLAMQRQALQTQKQEQENLLGQQQRQVAELQREARAVKDYVAGLDAQVAQKIREEEAAEQAAARRATEAAQQQILAEIASAASVPAAAFSLAATSASTSPSATTSESANSASGAKPSTRRRKTGSGDNSDSGTNSSSNSGSGGSRKKSGTQSAGAGWRNAVVARALALAGAREQYRYEYGAEGPSAFDCSGLTSDCYKQAGIKIGHSSGSQSSFCTKSISEAVPGDVVWRPGHVGIYIGNGRTVEALSPSSGLGYGSLNTFVRCGSP